MPWSNAAKNLMLDVHSSPLYRSAHSADPGDTGANELAGGIYDRQPMSYSLATGGNRDSTSQPSIPIPGGSTVTHTGLWDGPAGGTFLGSFPLAGPEVFAGDGSLLITDSDLTISDT